MDPPRKAGTGAYVAGEIVADKYRLIEPLGEGGMGSVWVGKNLALDVQVALKLLRTDVDTEGADERLLNEARATARLKHPNIVRVFDFGRTRRNDPFIVMEFLQGETLGDVLDREGRLAATFAVQLLLPCVDALAAAHSKGIVHRDLKPDNVFLADSDGRMVPKVVDFGIAKFAIENRDHRLTQAGTVIGSPDYMSPEQARGVEDIDHRADIWAFCVVLYECITGRVPFENANYNALLRHIIEDDVPSALDFAAGDPELWRILQKGFTKRRDGRYQSMRELGEQLAGWLMLHGVGEDVCGHSLRATWLDPPISNADGFLRQSVPPGRVSLPSVPGYTGRPSFPSSPDTHSATLRPPPVDDVVPDFRPRRSRTVVLGAIALVVIAVLGAITVALLSGPEEAPAASAPQPRAEPATESVEPTSASAPPKAPIESAETAETAEATRSAVPPPVAEPNPRIVAAPKPTPSVAPAPSAAPAPSKKSQYEDLGF
jgi:serine/threonine-protein kinase